MRRSVQRILCGAVLVVAACDARAPAPATIADAPEWHLSPQPRVSIGVAEGDNRYMFRRVNGVTRTWDGSIVVSDVGVEASLTLFDSTGQFIKRIGRRGNGPGEFQYPMSPFVYRRDSVAVWDLGQRRVSIYGVDGQLARTMNVIVPPQRGTGNSMPSQSCCRVAHALSNGSFVLEYPSMIPKEPGPVRHANLTLARISADAATSDTIGRYRDRQYRYDATSRSSVREIWLSWPFQYAVVGDTIFGGNGEGQWLLRQVPGSAPDTIRLAGVSVAVTDSVKAAFAQAYRDEFKRDPSHFEGSVEDLFEGAYADLVPAYTQVRSDNAGHLWLAQWALPYSREPLVFHIYSTGGTPVARIRLPARTWIMHLGANHVALVEYDADDVQYVRVYDIIRPPR